MSALDIVLAALESHGCAPRQGGGGSRQATCPAHEDQHPSLSLRAIEGRTLIFCHAGCDARDVVAALGLQMRDLFDDRRGVTYRYDSGRTVFRSPDKHFRQSHTDYPAELYKLTKVRHAVTNGATIFVVEGEQDAHALESIGQVATCNPMGAGAWRKVDSSPLWAAKQIVIVADRDEPGRKHARDVYDSLAGHVEHLTVVQARRGKDAADHVTAGCGVEDFEPVQLDPSRGQTAPFSVTLSDVQPERVDWLWPGWLPLGKIVVLDGDPGVGKSTLALDIAARVSTGAAWPDGGLARCGHVVVMSAEDGLADTIAPRLAAAHGDLSHVHALVEIRWRDETGPRRRPVSLADVDHIETVLRRRRALLLVVDVLMAYLPGNADAHRDQDVRAVLADLAGMAERTHCCVLMLRHLNKSGGGSALYRGGGSIGIIGAARAGFLAAVDPDDGTRRVLAPTKANLAAAPAALAYRLTDAPEHGCARIEWIGTCEQTAAGLLAQLSDDDERGQADELVVFLRMLLDDSGGEIRAADAIKALRGNGFTPAKDTLYRARRRAGIGTRKSDLKGGWLWSYDAEGSTKGRKDRSAGEAEPSEPSSEPSGSENALGRCQASERTDPEPPTCLVDGCGQPPRHGCRTCWSHAAHEPTWKEHSR